MHLLLLVVESDAGCYRKARDEQVVVGRLVEKRHAVRGRVERSGDIELLVNYFQVGHFRIVFLQLIECGLKNLLDALFLECDRSIGV